MFFSLTLIRRLWKNNFLRFFPYKCVRNQILPWHNVVKGEPRILCANFIGFTSQMLHTMTQDHWPFPSRDLIKGFYLIWAWQSSGSYDQEHLYKLSLPTVRNRHMKFELNWPCGFRCLDMLTDDRLTDRRRWH